MKDLSVLIPSNSEMFLAKTIENILENIEADTEIIAVLDGKWADPPIPQHPRVNVIYVPESVGQRAGTNLALKIAKGKYVAKVDAHCSFDKGFDRKMIDFFKVVGNNVVAVPIMRNLWAFDWKCYHCGWKKYQGRTPEKCEQCGKSDKIRRKMIWVGKERPQSVAYSFDSEPHFQYFNEFKNRQEYKDQIVNGYTETMSLQGSFFMAERNKFIELDLSDESVGNWGNQGLDVACRMWLSGGRVLVNHNTWYAHMFRTQGGDFGFPWHNSGKETDKTKSQVWCKIIEKRLPKQIYPVSWLVRRFMPVADWDEDKIKKLDG